MLESQDKQAWSPPQRRHATPVAAANRPDAPAPSGRAFEEIVGAVIAIWGTGVGLLSVRLAWGLKVVASLRRELVPFDDLPGVVADRLRRTLACQGFAVDHAFAAR